MLRCSHLLWLLLILNLFQSSFGTDPPGTSRRAPSSNQYHRGTSRRSEQQWRPINDTNQTRNEQQSQTNRSRNEQQAGPIIGETSQPRNELSRPIRGETSQSRNEQQWRPINEKSQMWNEEIKFEHEPKQQRTNSLSTFKVAPLSSHQPFYAVARGRKIGIFRDFEQYQRSVIGFSWAESRKFTNEADALAYLKLHRPNIQRNLEEDYNTAGGTPVVYISVFTGRDNPIRGQGIGKLRTGFGTFWGLAYPDQNTGTSITATGDDQQRAYYMAALMALRQAVQRKLPALVVKISGQDSYQSQWVAEALDQWIHDWSQNDWNVIGTEKRVKNEDLLLKIHAEVRKFHTQVSFVNIKEPGRDYGCGEASHLAIKGIRSGFFVEKDGDEVIKDLCEEFGELRRHYWYD